MKSQVLLLLLFMLSAFVWGCDDEPSSSNASNGGASGSGSGGTGNSLDPSHPACAGGEPLVLSLTENGEPSYDTGLREFEATLTGSTEDSAIFETCPSGGGEGGAGGGGATGGDGCLTLEIQANGLALPIGVGTSVDVLWHLARPGPFGSIGSMVVLHDLGDDSVEGFLLGVENGVPLADSPVSYTSIELNCAFDGTATCSAQIAYELTFTAVANPASSASLTMGETAQLELVPNDDTEWRVHNISSKISGGCDAFDPMRYYVVRDL